MDTAFLDGKAYSIPELESRLNFKYVRLNSFESPEEQQEIKERGLKKWKEGGVSEESQELGAQFIREIEAASIPHVSIRYLGEALGSGLFLEEAIEAGSYVGEYTGVVRKNDLRRYFLPSITIATNTLLRMTWAKITSSMPRVGV